MRRDRRAVRLAIDIDSTLHHHWPLVAAAAERRYGVELPYEQQFPSAGRRLSEEQLRVCIEDTHTDEAIAGARPYPHAVETVNRWYDAGHFVEITSHRAERSLAATRRWLSTSACATTSSSAARTRSRAVEQIGIDLLVDDLPDTLLRARDAGILVAALRHPWNAHVCDEPEVTCAAGWRELARVLEPVLAG